MFYVDIGLAVITLFRGLSTLAETKENDEEKGNETDGHCRCDRIDENYTWYNIILNIHCECAHWR